MYIRKGFLDSGVLFVEWKQQIFCNSDLASGFSVAPAFSEGTNNPLWFPPATSPFYFSLWTVFFTGFSASDMKMSINKSFELNTVKTKNCRKSWNLPSVCIITLGLFQASFFCDSQNSKSVFTFKALKTYYFHHFYFICKL